MGFVILALVGIGNLASAGCKETEKMSKYHISSDLEANQIFIEELKAHLDCLTNLHKEKYDAEFTKKYNQQKAEAKILHGRIRKLKQKENIILNPLKDTKKYGGDYFAPTDEQMQAYKRYKDDSEREKIEAVQRLGLDSDN